MWYQTHLESSVLIPSACCSKFKNSFTLTTISINPRTLMFGDFHPHNSCHMIFIVLLLSELHGSLCGFRLFTDVINDMFVSLLPWFFSRGMRSGDFHPTLVIENNIFYGWNLPVVGVCVFISCHPCINNQVLDQICVQYRCESKAKRRPLCVLYSMMNASVINSWLIHKENAMKRGDTQIKSM